MWGGRAGGRITGDHPLLSLGASSWFFTSLFPVTWDQGIEERTQVLEEDGHRLSSWLEMPHPVKLDDLGQFTPPRCLTGDTVQMLSPCSLAATCKWKLSSLVNAWISFLFLCKVVGWSLLSPKRQLLLPAWVTNYSQFLQPSTRALGQDRPHTEALFPEPKSQAKPTS